MKKVISILLVLVMIFSLCACDGKKSNTYMTIDGAQQDIDYLFTINDLRRADYVGKTVTFVAELTEVCGPTNFQQIVGMGSVDSCLQFNINGISQQIFVETSGSEDIIKNWNPGDMIEVSGQISFIFSTTVYILQFRPENNNITFKKI